MEKPVNYELSERSEGDKLQLISGSTSTLPRDHTGFNYHPSDIDVKAAKQPRSDSCLQNCCLVIVGVIAVLALCASVASIILTVAFPHVTLSTSQLGSVSGTPTSDSTNEQLRMLRETLASSVSDLSNSLGDTLSTVTTLLERLVTVQENGTCMNLPQPPIGSATYPASSCRDISSDRTSGDYWIQPDPNTCPIRVYCDLDGSACSCRCDITQGGWMRVANFDMKDPNQNCSNEFIEVTNNDPPLRLCGRPGPVGCSTMYFPVNGVEYSRVCGKVIGYRKGTPDGLTGANLGLDSHYLDGVSITHGLSPRTHIWSFIASWGFTSGAVGCPCDTNNYEGSVPAYIGSDYFCEGGHETMCCNFNLFPNNPVWDGRDCVDGSMCCGLNSPPYFCTTLDTPTSDPIEVRLCGNQETDDEDTPIESVELYVY